MHTYSYTPLEQPIGEFLLTVIPADELLKQYVVDPRKYEGDEASGTQRVLSKDRIKEIAAYTSTVDAAFPTAIVLALNEDQYTIDAQERLVTLTGNVEVIDGQHRIEGLLKASKEIDASIPSRFKLPCILIVEPTNEQKAFIFATINGKQTKVNSSLVVELFGVSRVADPWHLLHIVARSLNFKTDSPFHNRLKMLGVRTRETESLTQGTFVKSLMPLLSKSPDEDRNIIKKGDWEKLKKDPKLPLRSYMITQTGDLLVPLISNIFSAVRDTWPIEWSNHNKFNLSKTTGFAGIAKGLPEPLRYGIENGVVTKQYFSDIFQEMKRIMTEEMNGAQFTNTYFTAGGVGENGIRDLVGKAYGNLFPNEERMASLKAASQKK